MSDIVTDIKQKPSRWFNMKLIHAVIYIMILTLFFKSIILQYCGLFLFILFFFINHTTHLKKRALLITPLLLLFVAIASWLFNLFLNNADEYSILFWVVAYIPNFLLAWLIISFRNKIDFYKIYKFYKVLVYLQSFLLIYSSLVHGRYIVGDPASGTVGDANWVAFHILVVLLYEVIKHIEQSKHGLLSLRRKLISVTEIIYFLIIFIIPESTANLGFLLIVLGIFFLNEYLFCLNKMARSLVLIVFLITCMYFVSKTIVYERIDRAITAVVETDLEDNPYLSKINTYKKLFSGELYSEANFLLGSGPATFTSRASVVRMPEERVNVFPVELPYFKSEIFKKFISPINEKWRISGESYGNFASPQTTIISISVELGIIGIALFLLFFHQILKINGRTYHPLSNCHLKKFVKYLTLYFVLSLFHLNFWEYPLVSFTYIIFVFSIIEPKTIKKKLT